MTIARDLQQIFCIYKARLQLELQQHTTQGGQISLTFDTWSARNYSEYAVVTAHWISDRWQFVRSRPGISRILAYTDNSTTGSCTY